MGGEGLTETDGGDYQIPDGKGRHVEGGGLISPKLHTLERKKHHTL